MNTPSIGIAVITYKRPDYLIKCLKSIINHTGRSVELSIFDDGSDLETLRDAAKLFRLISTKINGGVVQNKNRALYYYTEINPKDIIILLEDDTIIDSSEWIDNWTNATLLHGHINYSPPWFMHESLRSEFVGGENNFKQPSLFKILTGQCTGVLRKHIKEDIGYLNPRFKGYGHGHVEWTNRFVDAAIGGFNENNRRIYKAITGNISAPPAPSFKSEEELRKNLETLIELNNNKTLFVKNPWLSDADQSVFEDMK